MWSRPWSVFAASLMASAVLLAAAHDAEARRKARYREQSAVSVRVVVVAPCDPAKRSCADPAPEARRPRVYETTTPQGVRLRVIEY